MLVAVVRTVRRVWFFITLLTVFVAMALGLYLSIPYDWAMENDVHFPLYLFIIMALMSAASELDKKSESRWPQSRVAHWSIQTAALVSCYVSWLMPEALLTATLLTSFVSLILWLGLVQSYRRLIRRRIRREIALALHIEETDPVAHVLANNSDFPTAIVTAVFLSSQTILLLGTWAPELSSMVVRSSGFMIGFLTGVAYFTWCPHQSDIREAINKVRRDASLNSAP